MRYKELAQTLWGTGTHFDFLEDRETVFLYLTLLLRNRTQSRLHKGPGKCYFEPFEAATVEGFIYVNLKIDGVRNFRIKRFNQAFSKKNVEKITFSILPLVCNQFKFRDFKIFLW